MNVTRNPVALHVQTFTMKRTTKKIIIIFILLVCAGFIIFPKIFKGEQKVAVTEEKQPVDERLSVAGMVINNNALEDNLRVTGSLVASEFIELKSEVDGIVEKIYFKEGQKVKKGTLLVQLDNDEIAAEIQKLQYTQKLNEDMEYRQKQLLEREAISQEEYDVALASLNTIKAELRLKQVQLSKRQIRAPFDGIIGLRNISEGSYVTSSTVIATLYNNDPIKIDFAVPGKYAAEVNEGDKINFTVDAYDDVFTGNIYAVEPQINPQTRTLQVRATSANKENRLLPGQFAKIEITLDTYENAIMIPTEAVIPELNGKKVYVLEDGVAETRQVETGIRTATDIQVVSGLNPGDTLLTTGMMQLQPGMPVKVNL